MIAKPSSLRAMSCSSLSNLLTISASDSPLNSTTRMSVGSPWRKSILRAKLRWRRAWVMMIEPMCSTADGSCSSVATVASIDSSRLAK